MIPTYRLHMAALGLALVSTISHAATININFGIASAANGWNNVPSTTGTSVGEGLTNLIDSSGEATLVDLTINARFGGTNQNGPTTQSFGIPSDVSASSLYGNGIAFNGIVSPNPTFTLSDLDPGLVYTFTVYASRTGVSDNRTGTYTATGLNTVSGQLNASNNTSLTLALLEVRPDASGNIVFELEPHADNNNGNRFIYLNALTIESASLIPEPAAAAGLAGATTLLLACVRRPRRAP